MARSPTAAIEIGGVPVGCVLDTGAETSLMPYSFYEENLAGVVGLENVATFMRIVGVNGLDVPFEGCLEVQITIFGQIIMASFLVQQDATGSGVERNAKYPVILGCNLLRAIADRGMAPLGPSKDDWQLASSWLKLVHEGDIGCEGSESVVGTAR